MSGPATSLPPEIRELLTVDVIWEQFTGKDLHNQASYAAPVTLAAFVEEYAVAGGMAADRQPGVITVEPKVFMYFDGDDARVEAFSLDDRFTVPGVASNNLQKLKPLRINPYYGPNFDNVNPWLIEVVL